MPGYTADVIEERGVLEEGFLLLPKPLQRARSSHAAREVLDR